MIYDLVVIGDEVDPKRTHWEEEAKDGAILYIQLDQLENTKFLELKKEDGIFELTIMTDEGCVVWVHSRNVVITSYTTHKECKGISIYEILWAANVRLNSDKLSPVIDKNYETSIKNLYFCIKED